jgi:hypothetical protein
MFNTLERLFQTTPNYSSLCVFGCACCPNLRPYMQHKLQFRSKQCIFLGYGTQHKGFKYLDIFEGRIYISRDVVFDESVYPFAKLHPNTGARLRGEISLLPPHLYMPITNCHGGVCLTGNDTTLIDSPNPANKCAEPSHGHTGNKEANSEEIRENREETGGIQALVYHFMQGGLSLVKAESALVKWSGIESASGIDVSPDPRTGAGDSRAGAVPPRMAHIASAPIEGHVSNV